MNQEKKFILSAMIGRHETVKLFFVNAKLPVIMVVSNEEDKLFASHHTQFVIEAPNSPLALKWQAGIDYLKNIDFEYMVILGSDDIMNEETYKFIDNEISDCDFMGFTDFYFYDQIKNKTYYWKGYENVRKGEPLGAGRVLTKNCINKLQGNVFYKDMQTMTDIDSYMWKRITSENVTKKIFTLKENNLFIVDIKDNKNLNSIHQISQVGKIQEYSNGFPFTI